MQDTHATCRVCSRHRRIAATDEDGRPQCAGCAGAVPATRQCPDCGTVVLGGGAAPCRACSLRRRIAHRAALNAETLDQSWLRALFLEFCAWDGLSRTAPATPRRLGAYARCFAAIGGGCADRSEVSQERLLALLGAEGLRRNQLVVRFLAGRLALDWSPQRAEAFVEAGRIGAVLAATDGQPWGPALRAYRDHLALDSTLHPGTVRSYLNAAVGLLAQAGHADLALLKQAEVQIYLRRRPGQGASLARFLAHAARVGGTQLALPVGKRRADPKAREKALLREAKELLDRLDRAGDVGEGRAMLAAAISKIYAVRLSAVLKLRAPDAAVDGAAVTLWPGGLAVGLSSALADALLRWASWEGGYLFPGRNGAQPLSRDAVRHHVRAKPTRGQPQSC